MVAQIGLRVLRRSQCYSLLGRDVKTFKNLYPCIYDFENLYWAYRRARKGKRNRRDVAEFEFNLSLSRSRNHPEGESRILRQAQDALRLPRKSGHEDKQESCIIPLWEECYEKRQTTVHA